MTGDALAAGAGAALSRDEVARRITDAYEGVVPVPSWGETSFFYNPGRAFTRGAYFCTLKDHDGENDRASALDRPGVYRLAFGVPPSTFERLFGPRPPRPGKGGVVEGPWDFTALDRLTPHPVYAWMGWLSVLNPSAMTFDLVGPLLAQAHERARVTFEKRLRR